MLNQQMNKSEIREHAIQLALTDLEFHNEKYRRHCGHPPAKGLVAVIQWLHDHEQVDSMREAVSEMIEQLEQDLWNGGEESALFHLLRSTLFLHWLLTRNIGE